MSPPLPLSSASLLDARAVGFVVPKNVVLSLVDDHHFGGVPASDCRTTCPEQRAGASRYPACGIHADSQLARAERLALCHKVDFQFGRRRDE